MLLAPPPSASSVARLRYEAQRPKMMRELRRQHRRCHRELWHSCAAHLRVQCQSPPCRPGAKEHCVDNTDAATKSCGTPALHTCECNASLRRADQAQRSTASTTPTLPPRAVALLRCTLASAVPISAVPTWREGVLRRQHRRCHREL